MSLPVVVTRRAAREISDASEWWEANRTSAPDALLRDLEAALALIAREPRCGAPATGTLVKGVRRVLLPRIRYHLYYRIARRPPGIQVLAFWHAHRSDPSL